MIRTQSKLQKKDYLYIAKLERWKSDKLVLYFLEILCGIAILWEVFPMLRAVILQHYCYGVTETLLMWLALLFAIGCIGTPLFNPYIIAIRSYKTHDKRSVPELVFGDEGVLLKSQQEGIASEQQIAYSIVDKYFEHRETLYIRFYMDRVRLYLTVREDGYLTGSKEELVTLLEAKEIQRG